jgi:hypothetical protein
MANPEHLAKLKKGVDAWNEWRAKNRGLTIDLTRADLGGEDLTRADLGGADLTCADLRGAELTGADLRGAKLGGANLYVAALISADLSGAELGGADIISADLRGADLRGAGLITARITYAHLDYADFSKVRLRMTTFSDVDLSAVKGLDSVLHYGPCTIGIDTLYKSKGKIPESFLRGCGVPEDFIEHTRALVSNAPPIQFYSVFISYSSKDQAFAERLHADLQSKKVRCWFAPEDLKIGEKFRMRIDEVIRVYDKLLLVLSENSVESDWVEKEVESAMEKERQQKRTMLFPIRLDDAVMKIDTGWPADVRRTRHIGDFTNWKDHDAYQKAFDRLMRDLKADEKKTA